jgi:hypothetical protein
MTYTFLQSKILLEKNMSLYYINIDVYLMLCSYVIVLLSYDTSVVCNVRGKKTLSLSSIIVHMNIRIQFDTTHSSWIPF